MSLVLTCCVQFPAVSLGFAFFVTVLGWVLKCISFWQWNLSYLKNLPAKNKCKYEILSLIWSSGIIEGALIWSLCLSPSLDFHLNSPEIELLPEWSAILPTSVNIGVKRITFRFDFPSSDLLFSKSLIFIICRKEFSVILLAMIGALRAGQLFPAMDQSGLRVSSVILFKKKTKTTKGQTFKSRKNLANWVSYESDDELNQKVSFTITWKNVWSWECCRENRPNYYSTRTVYCLGQHIYRGKAGFVCRFNCCHAYVVNLGIYQKV